VGVRGTRIKNIIRELNNEKIDVIPYANDPIQFLQNLLAPSEVSKLKIYDRKISIVVKDEDYPIVIGKKGMNARLIGQMMDKDIEVQKLSEYQKILAIRMAELSESEDTSFDDKLRVEGVSGLITESLISAGYHTLRDLMKAEPAEIPLKVPGVNYYDIADKVLEQTRKKQV
jgi:N utilization substance protein A